MSKTTKSKSTSTSTASNATSLVSNSAASWINSRIKSGQSFTLSEYIAAFPSEKSTSLVSYAYQMTAANNYDRRSTFVFSPGAAPSKSAVVKPVAPVSAKSTMTSKSNKSSNKSSVNTYQVVSRESTNGGKTIWNLPLSSTMTSNAKLSTRAYHYTVDMNTRTVVVYRNSSAAPSGSPMFSVWSNGRGLIPLTGKKLKVSTFTITVQ